MSCLGPLHGRFCPHILYMLSMLWLFLATSLGKLPPVKKFKQIIKRGEQMKNLGMAMLLLGTVTTQANVCRTWEADGPYSIAICAKKTLKTENGVRLEGLYLESAYSHGEMGLKKLTNKKKICQIMGYPSYVSDSVVIERRETAIVRGEQAIMGTFKVITEIECE